MVNSTFANNGGTSGGAGGGIFDVGGPMTITNSTFSGNKGVNSAPPVGNIFIFGSTASLKGSILAGQPSAGDCKQTEALLNDLGHNIADDSSCGFTAPGSQNNTDPIFDPVGLADNGRPTQTIVLQSNSPAIVAIPVADCTDQASPPNPIITDQRGFPRPDAKEQVCDIGAYEFQDAPAFAGQPGKPNCHGKTVSELNEEFGNLNAAASALGFSSVKALQSAITQFCKAG